MKSPETFQAQKANLWVRHRWNQIVGIAKHIIPEEETDNKGIVTTAEVVDDFGSLRIFRGLGQSTLTQVNITYLEGIQDPVRVYSKHEADIGLPSARSGSITMEQTSAGLLVDQTWPSFKPLFVALRSAPQEPVLPDIQNRLYTPSSFEVY